MFRGLRDMADMCERASVSVLGKMAVIKSERGGKAIVGLSSICSMAKRLGLCLDNYQC